MGSYIWGAIAKKQIGVVDRIHLSLITVCVVLARALWLEGSVFGILYHDL